MAASPSLPGWQALHPIVMHIAIPVLLLAPLFIVLFSDHMNRLPETLKTLAGRLLVPYRKTIVQ